MSGSVLQASLEAISERGRGGIGTPEHPKTIQSNPYSPFPHTPFQIHKAPTAALDTSTQQGGTQLPPTLQQSLVSLLA